MRRADVGRRETGEAGDDQHNQTGENLLREGHHQENWGMPLVTRHSIGEGGEKSEELATKTQPNQPDLRWVGGSGVK